MYRYNITTAKAARAQRKAGDAVRARRIAPTNHHITWRALGEQLERRKHRRW